MDEPRKIGQVPQTKVKVAMGVKKIHGPNSDQPEGTVEDFGVQSEQYVEVDRDELQAIMKKAGLPDEEVEAQLNRIFGRDGENGG